MGPMSEGEVLLPPLASHQPGDFMDEDDVREAHTSVNREEAGAHTQHREFCVLQ